MEIRNNIYNFKVDSKITGKYIKDLRKSKGMTAEMLADALYCSVKTISSWETGARFPSLDNLVDIANYFDVTVHSLMLPHDNCKMPCLEIFPCEAGCSNHLYNRYHIPKADDSVISTLFIREEYLLQRIFSGDFTKANKCEYETALMYAFNARKSPKYFDIGKPYSNTSETYFDFLKHQENRYHLFHILLNKLWRGENLPLTISALNRFERDVLFTTCVYFEELRNEEYARLMYEIGARFIDCDFIKNKRAIETYQTNSKTEKVFNISYGVIRDEYTGKEIKLLGEQTSTSTEEGKKLLSYYCVLDFVRNNISTLENYKSRIVGLLGLDYTAYIQKIKESGLV